MIDDSDIYYCGSLLPWAEWVDANPHLVSAESRAKAALVFKREGEIWCAMAEIELRLRVARS
jgi:hypothetical protein